MLAYYKKGQKHKLQSLGLLLLLYKRGEELGTLRVKAQCMCGSCHFGTLYILCIFTLRFSNYKTNIIR